MLKNYLKIALRNITRHKGYSFINIFGLAIGLAVFMLIALFIKFELSFDRFHEHFNDIYRVEQILVHEGVENATVDCPGPLSQVLQKDFPEFAAVTRVIEEDPGELSVSGDIKINAKKVFFTDNSFLDIFSFPLEKGDKSTVLEQPFSIVISQDLAKALFGSEDQVGKTLRSGITRDLKVTGVLKNIPLNSHLQFDALISVSTMPAIWGNDTFAYWLDNLVPLYVQLGENVSPGQVDEKIRFLLKKYQGKESPNKLYLKPLSRIHLYSHINTAPGISASINDLGVNGSIENVIIFAVVALFVLIIACINFMNLTTARSVDRAKEVGVRKVSGAPKTALVKQFLGESIFTAVLAMLTAVILVEILLPEFNSIVNRQLKIDDLSKGFFPGIIVVITLLVGIFSGFYPALVLSSHQPLRVLKNSFSPGSRKPLLRKSLVILQFFISVVLIMGMIVVLRQVNHLLHKDLGFDSEQVLQVRIDNPDVRKNHLLRSEILGNPQVINAGVSDYKVYSSTNWTIISYEGAPGNTFLKINVNYVDENLMDTYNMKIVKGRGFSKEFVSDAGNAVILNETAARMIGWDDPIGKRLLYDVDYRSRSLGGATVVGIVKDYHFLSLHHSITPMMIRLYSRGWHPQPIHGQPEVFLSGASSQKSGEKTNFQKVLVKETTGSYFSVKIAARDIPKTLSFIEKKFLQAYPQQTFNYQFLDEEFQRVYQEERKFGKVIFYLALLAIFIACLGLFGLASFSTRQRTKEIGIRKIIGATVPGVTRLLTGEFLKLTIIATVFAWPIAYILMTQWLQNFPYRVGIDFWVFLASGAAAVLFTLATVSFQAIKTAVANPVEALRYE
jgi:putative ABC transport system permease protein